MSYYRKQILSHTFIFTLILSFLLFLFFACEKFEPKRIVKVETVSITNIEYRSCTAQGSIIDVGENGIDQHGFCWSTSQDPTVNDSKQELGPRNSTGNFPSNLTDLIPDRTYYIRAFAQSQGEDFYGDQKSFVTLAPVKPKVETESVSSITQNSAQCGGNITDDGGTPVTARGVCWSISENPTISESKTVDGTGTGSFASNLTGLTPGTTYYVKAYATNSAGTEYGNQVSFTTDPVELPTLTTTAASSITQTSAASGGNITDDGGAPVTARGVCWSTSPNPTTADNTTSDGTGTGSFESNLTGLTPGTTYYVRAYATNSAGTAYGNELSFRTPIIDYDGNLYETVQIGSQVWMAENLRTTKYNDGANIPLVTNSTEWADLTTPGYCYYNNDMNTYGDTYGALYNWYAVSSTTNGGKNICPVGWHVPNDSEWTTLEDYLIANGYNYDGTTTGDKTAKSLAANFGWEFSSNIGAVGNTDYPEKRNVTGFTALPSGQRDFAGTFYDLGTIGYWWSLTENATGCSWFRRASYRYYDVYRDCWNRRNGFSVRCVND